MVEGGDEKMKGLAIYGFIIVSISLSMMWMDVLKGDVKSLTFILLFVPIDIFFVEFLIRKYIPKKEEETW